MLNFPILYTFLQSTSVTNVYKLLQLLGTSSSEPPTGLRS